MLRTLKRLTTIAYAYYQRFARKIKQLSLISRYRNTEPAPRTTIKENIFFQQQGKFFYSNFPLHSLNPDSLLLCDSDQPQPCDDAFWYRLTGHAKGHYSLAIVNRALVTALYRHSNGQACFVPFDNGVKTSFHHMQEVTEPTLKLAICNSIPPKPEKPIVSIVHHYPVMTDDETSDIRLIIFFWEESQVPSETVEILNTNFNAILVATSFVATTLRNSGCAIPIFVIPIGVDHLVDYSKPLSPLRQIKYGERFRFLHVSSVFERKGPEFLLAAFFTQFSAQDPVELYIKTFPNPHNRIHALLAHFKSTQPNPPHVIIDETDVSNDTLQMLYRSAHTLVLPTRGEGFNLPAAEALALGLPVIVTGFGGQTDFCTAKTSTLIPFGFDLSMSHLNQGQGCWVTPDVCALATLMQQSVNEVCGHSDQLNQRRAAGHALMRSRYTWDKAAQGVAHALHWLTAHGDVDQQVSMRHLTFSSFLEILDAETPNQDALVMTFRSPFGESDIPIIPQESLSATIDVLDQLNKRGKILILDLSFTKNLAKFNVDAVFLKCFDRIIVESVDSLNKMLSFTEPHNIMVLPSTPTSCAELNDRILRNRRLQNMIKGLRYDRQFKQYLSTKSSIKKNRL